MNGKFVTVPLVNEVIDEIGNTRKVAFTVLVPVNENAHLQEEIMDDLATYAPRIKELANRWLQTQDPRLVAKAKLVLKGMEELIKDPQARQAARDEIKKKEVEATKRRLKF